jgi:DNA-binding response OmpR family regulator
MGKTHKKILLIDDDEETLINLRIMLRGRDFEISHALTGDDGLARLKEEQFDLIILDIMMPKDSGFRCLDRLRQDMKITTPVLVYSALDDWDAFRSAVKRGAQDYLKKAPETDRAKFLAAVDDLVYGSQCRRTA